MNIENIGNGLPEKINIQSIYNKLDHDPEINKLLGKHIDEEGDPQGENIWPSNMVISEGDILKIDGSEFDRAIEEAKDIARADDDQERVTKINEIANKKQELISLIETKLQNSGYSIEII